MEPTLSKVLPPHAFVFDLIHYFGKLKPSPLTNGKWPLGATLRPSFLGSRFAALDPKRGKVESLPGVFTIGTKKSANSKSAANKARPSTLQPSVAAALRDFTKNDCYKSDLNLFSSNKTTRTELMQEAWRRALEVTSLQSTDKKSICHVPISTVEHENTQLVWGRHSQHNKLPVDDCCYGVDCDAHKIRANQGVLQRYMTPSEQQHFDTTYVSPCCTKIWYFTVASIFPGTPRCSSCAF